MALPKGYSVPSSSPRTPRYMKLDKGANKFQVMSDVVTGYVYWDETDEGRRPTRVKSYKEVPAEVISREDDRAKHFWAMVVWNFKEEALQILEVTQRTVQLALESYETNEDYGDLKGYPITINRSGEGFDTTYTVVPSPQKPAPKEAVEALKETTVDLDSLFSGDDPFAQGGTDDDEVDLDSVLEELDKA